MKVIAFKDRVKVYLSAGNGGNGCASFRREKYVPRGGPDGGDGGKGGDIYFVADKNVDSLIALYYKPHQRAGHGGHGKTQKCHGKNGANVYIKIPCGTEVHDAIADEYLGEVLREGESLLVAKGGKGGLGNCHFSTSSNRAPRHCTPGEEGEEKTLWLELKMVAEVGLAGYPNAGKSTLLSQLSDAHPKIAAYPFTTLQPTIGTVFFDDYNRIRVADIPGLIQGAHKGVGLGHDFLRHIERTQFLLFIIDMAGTDGRDPADDYLNLRQELKLYRKELDQRPYRVIANKMDVPQAQTYLRTFQERTGESPLQISAARGQGLDVLTQTLHQHFFSKKIKDLR